MFSGKTFYHQHIRKAIIAFGTIFNNISVLRKNAAGEIVQDIRIPLSYVPKQKAIARITEVGDLESGRAKYEITLPRIGFEIVGLSYDSPRKLVATSTVRAVMSDKSMKYGFVSTPYNLNISMSIFAKNQDDGLQILEQILPYFNPDFNITVNELPELGTKRDLMIELTGVNYNDEYTGTFDERSTIIWDLNFTVKMNFYGYVNNVNLIKKTIANIYADIDGTVGVRITTTPDPTTADVLDDYTFVQEFDNIFPG